MLESIFLYKFLASYHGPLVFEHFILSFWSPLQFKIYMDLTLQEGVEYCFLVAYQLLHVGEELPKFVTPKNSNQL